MAVIDMREIWRGVNAPLFPVNQFGRKPFLILGFSVYELVYLFSVAVLWYFVGLAYERAKSDISAPRRPYLGSFQLIWGIIMLFLAVWQIPEAFPWTYAYGRIFRPVVLFVVAPYLVWSVVLVLSGAKKLRRTV